MLHAFILHTIPYKDSSLIIKFFTKDHGIVTLVANGARRRRSKFLGILRPFVPLEIYWKNRSSSLATLYNAEIAGPGYKLIGKELFSGIYINELLLKLLPPEDPEPALFLAYQQSLANLSLLENSELMLGARQLQLQQNLRWFEKQILKALGYELQLDRDNLGQELDPASNYYFDGNHGIKKDCMDGGGRHYGINLRSDLNGTKLRSALKVVTISGKDLLAFHKDQVLELQQMQAIKLFMRGIIEHFLGGKVLLVRELFRG